MHQEIQRKRPCRICRKWFRPDPRQKGRQYTCGDPGCQRERHRRNCDTWRQRNPDYDRESRLRERLKRGKEKGPYVELSQGINVGVARDALGLQRYVVIDEIGKVLLDMTRDALCPQPSVYKGKIGGLPPVELRDGMESDHGPP